MKVWYASEKNLFSKKLIISLSCVILTSILIAIPGVISIINQDAVTLDYIKVVFSFLLAAFCVFSLCKIKFKLEINDDEFVFYIRTFSKYDEYNQANTKGLHIKIEDIESLSFLPQSKVNFKMKNGKAFEAWIANFGKAEDAEILSFMRLLNDKKQIENDA